MIDVVVLTMVRVFVVVVLVPCYHCGGDGYCGGDGDCGGECHGGDDGPGDGGVDRDVKYWLRCSGETIINIYICIFD